MCGTADWEWEEDRRAYEPIEKFCHGCYLKSLFGSDSSDMPGTTIELTPTGTVEHAQRLVKQKQHAAREARKADGRRSQR